MKQPPDPPAARPPRGDVHIEIGTLELTGWSPAHRFAIAQTFERELTRLLENQPMAPPTAAPQRAEQSTEVTAPGLRSDASPHALGTALARAIYDAIRRS